MNIFIIFFLNYVKYGLYIYIYIGNYLNLVWVRFDVPINKIQPIFIYIKLVIIIQPNKHLYFIKLRKLK